MKSEPDDVRRAFGDAKHCRKLFQRILNSVSDWPESITEAYVQFEREEGDSLHVIYVTRDVKFVFSFKFELCL